jgi:hypothetical protein
MRYQLVIQFEGSSIADFDKFSILEKTLSNELGELADVDGHDFGSGEFNIFTFTEYPVETFQRALEVIQGRLPRRRVKIAYREVADENFVILWPSGAKEFKLV